MEILFVIIALLVVAILVRCIHIVPQASEYVIEFLGKYHKTWGAGIHLKIPFLERISKKVTLKEQVLDSPPQPVITKDNVTMQIDTVIYYAIYNAKLYAYGAVNPILEAIKKKKSLYQDRSDRRMLYERLDFRHKTYGNT